jgi:hypothetical protein
MRNVFTRDLRSAVRRHLAISTEHAASVGDRGHARGGAPVRILDTRAQERGHRDCELVMAREADRSMRACSLPAGRVPIVNE